MCDFASLARGSIKTRTGEALSSSPRDRFAQARLATKPLHSPVVAPQTWNDDDSLLLGFGLFKASTRVTVIVTGCLLRILDPFFQPTAFGFCLLQQNRRAVLFSCLTAGLRGRSVIQALLLISRRIRHQFQLARGRSPSQSEAL
jgi:hypothetical protein